MLFSCVTSVASRSSLNIIDRYLFRNKEISFKFVYFTSIFLPFIYGFLFLPFVGNIQDVFASFLTLRCFLLALATNLVGLSFSYAFRHKDVKHVILHTKIPEFFLPFLLLIPFFSELQPLNVVSWKHYVPLVLMWLAFIPYFKEGNHKKILFDSSAICIFISLLFQMTIASTVRVPLITMADLLVFTMAVLLWRCILSLVLFTKKNQSDDFSIKNISKSIFILVAVRGFVALATQFTFNWAIMDGHPMFVWPILNTTLIVSSIASQVFLKEQIHKSDWIALLGVFASSCLIQIL